GETVDAVDDQQQADAETHIAWIEIGEQYRAEGDADHPADDERRNRAPVQRLPQLPDAVTLRAKAITGDQHRCLYRRDDVQADAGYHEAHGKAGQAGCEAT